MTKILIADDEVCDLMGFALRLAGFEVVLAADGVEAIEKATLEQPDLILLDVHMPKITGYEACRRLKQNPATCAIPVVIVTVRIPDEVNHGLDSGAVEFIMKPFSPDELTSQVRDILRRHRLGIYGED